MPEAELGAYREALAVQVSDVDKRLAQQVRRRPIGTFWHPLAPLGTFRHRWPETVPR